MAFTSLADNLVPGDTNGAWDAFVRDRQNLTTERVSVSSSGAQTQGVGAWEDTSISDDGRYVSFNSPAYDLVAGDTNGSLDAFVHDRVTHTTTRVSVSSSGSQASGFSYTRSISADGRYVAFVSTAANLVVGDTNGKEDVFVHDRSNSTTTRISVDSNGMQGNLDSFDSAISADGRYVAFVSGAWNLVPGDTNVANDVFVHDMQTGATIRVSVDSNGTQANYTSLDVAISGDGRYVAFTSDASNLVAGDTNGCSDAFVRDRVDDTTTRVSLNTSGGQANNSTLGHMSMSADGRYVAFESLATNLIVGDTNERRDIFVHDRQSAKTARVSVDSVGAEANQDSYVSSLSADGQFVIFNSVADNLVPGDTNGVPDVFVHEHWWGPCSVATYCTAGTSADGCVPQISGTGSPSVTGENGFTIDIDQVPGQRLGLIYYGVTGQAALPWGTGSSWLCVEAPRQRTGMQDSGGTSGQCDGRLSIDWNAYHTSNPNALGNPFAAGLAVDAQAWFRDPGVPKQSTLTGGLHFTLCN